LKYRVLGRTGLQVPAVSLGTVSLGVDYGIAAPGQFGRPDEAAAVHLLREAVERGITLIDTAPAYGASERLIGRAVGSNPRVLIATKVTVTENGAFGGRTVRDAVDASLKASRHALGRDVLDVVQIHNATRKTIEDGRIAGTLLEATRRGDVRFIGASVYSEDAALAVIASGQFDVLQVAYNALDRRMATTVLPAADAAGIGVLVRSAFLKGALTPKAQWLPDALAPLRAAAERARDLIADGEWADLPFVAIRFCLSALHVSSVLIGPRTLDELDAAIKAEAAGPLAPAVLARIAGLTIDDEQLLNPSHWPVL
jgi:aryl-alcohol dehydrogenase-like predicted oxidoreductase